MTQRSNTPESNSQNPTPTAPISDERIRSMLENPNVQAKAQDTEMEARVQQNFEQNTKKVRSKLGSAWDDVRDAYRMSFDKSFNLEPKVRGALLVALMYLVVPIDLIPDPIPVIGVADDIAVIVFAIRYARPEIERYRAFRAERELGKRD
jgi:uncharacterized membrane protein YkvA (DUF1232 family)